MRGRAGGLHASRGENDVCLGSNQACVCVCVCVRVLYRSHLWEKEKTFRLTRLYS